MDDKHPHKHSRTVPIRKRQGEGSSREIEDSSIEGTFISLSHNSLHHRDFINPKFTEDENEDVVRVIDLQHEERTPLFLLFPDLDKEDIRRLSRTTSTTQVAQILKGKKADFSLLKPSKKLNPEQGRLSPVIESSSESCEQRLKLNDG